MTRTLLALLAAVQDESAPEDRRRTELRHLNLDYSFSPPATLEQWLARKEHLRHQILVAAGLLPAPLKTPLDPHSTGTIEREDYAIERIRCTSLPGFYVTGNLYRPKDLSRRYPGIAQPHGHMSRGRLADDKLFSPPARSIQLARMGCVSFSYDMVGFNDSVQLRHGCFDSAEAEVWGLSNLGLQLWNSIRVVDFLQSLPFVDPSRIACTGESGGGTQTFLLTAVDERVGLSAPVNMISHTMQGGCRCENAGLLRLDTSNVEIGAMMAPRDMILIAATGDWTKDTPSMEFPAIRSVYRLFRAEDRLGMRQFEAPHNFHRASREAVYGFFARALGFGPKADPVPETPYVKEPDQVLRVWGPADRPGDAVSPEGLFRWWKEDSARRWEEARRNSLDFARVYGEAYRACLAAEEPAQVQVLRGRGADRGAYTVEELWIGRPAAGDAVRAIRLVPARPDPRLFPTVLVDSEGLDSALDPATGEPRGLALSLASRGDIVIALEPFRAAPMKHKFWTCYNRTEAANRIQDILTALAFAGRANLAGRGAAGLWCLLARPLSSKIERTYADARPPDEASWTHDLFIPSIRRIGDLKTALALGGDSGLLLGGRSDAEWPVGPQAVREKANDRAIADWLLGSRK